MAETCAHCGAIADENHSYCVQCGSELGSLAFEFSDAARRGGPRYCSQCGNSVEPGDVNCPHCGEKIVDVLLGAHLAPRVSRKKRREPKKGFAWRWFFSSAGFIFLATLAGVLLAAAAEGMGLVEGEDASALLFILGIGGGIFIGAFIAAWRSPGRTVLEPALATAGLAVLLSLPLGAGVFGSALCAVLASLTALPGAWLGEKVQTKRDR